MKLTLGRCANQVGMSLLCQLVDFVSYVPLYEGNDAPISMVSFSR